VVGNPGQHADDPRAQIRTQPGAPIGPFRWTVVAYCPSGLRGHFALVRRGEFGGGTKHMVTAHTSETPANTGLFTVTLHSSRTASFWRGDEDARPARVSARPGCPGRAAI